MAVRARAVSTLVAALVLAALAGCTSAGSAGGSSVRPNVKIVPGAAKLDPVGVQIQEPLDVYAPSVEDQRTIARAQDLYVIDCVGEKGSPLALPDVYAYPVSPKYDFRYFGVWTPDVAARFGHGPPTDPLREANDEADASIPEATYNEIISCLQAPAANAFKLPVEQGTSVAERGFQESWRWAESDPAVQATFTAYRACMAPKGYEFDDDYSHYSPVAADPNATGTEADIVSAIDEVACKTEAGLPQTFADAAYAYQLAFIESNQAALAAERATFDDQLEHASDLIADHR